MAANTPVVVTLADHYQGDDWVGMTVGPVLINSVQPVSPIKSCKIQFKHLRTKELGYTLTSEVGDPLADPPVPPPDPPVGQIILTDPETWIITVPEQPLPLTAGEWEWDFETINEAGRKLTLYQGVLKVNADKTK